MLIIFSEIKIVGLTKVLPGVVETVERFIKRQQFDRKQGNGFESYPNVK